MPQQERSFRRQKALLWLATGTDRFGQPTVTTTPVEIKVRWNTNRAERLAPDGTTVTVDGTAVVDQIIPIDSLMWLGTLEEWLGTGSGLTDTELCVVKTFRDTPDLKARASFKEAGLMRYHGKPLGG